MRYLILALVMLVGVGCSAIDFINCGDSGICFEGRKYGCNGSEKCLKVKKEKCLKENSKWNEEYGYCEAQNEN